MQQLRHKKLIVGITGSIAAYKAAELIRRLVEAGAEVQVVMTQAAKAFITPLTLQALSGRPVREQVFDTQAEAAMGHIDLARWADAIVVAPASANFIAKLAHGFADDLLTTLCLASQARILLAPAMNQQMWANSATQANFTVLQQRGMVFLGPVSGVQACGDMGFGRLMEVPDLLSEITGLFSHTYLQGLHVLLTAGPTQEAIDPIRYMSNRSSGKMGYALAEAARAAGAEVTLITGPTQLPIPFGIKSVAVTTAEQMQQAVIANCKDKHIFIASAAVADYRCQQISSEKIPKASSTWQLNLIANPDILASVAALPQPPFTVGFAAQTSDLIQQAKRKLRDKRIDMIAANLVGEQQGIEQDDNAVTVLWEDGQREFPLAKKSILARQLVEFIAERYYAKHPAQNLKS